MTRKTAKQIGKNIGFGFVVMGATLLWFPMFHAINAIAVAIMGGLQ